MSCRTGGIRCLLAVHALILAAASAPAQERAIAAFLSFDVAVERAIAASVEVAVRERALADARVAVGAGAILRGLGITLGAGIDGNAADPFSLPGSGSASVSVNVLPQLSVAASISVADTAATRGSVDVTVRPLAPSTSRERARLAVDRAEADLRAEAQAASFAAVTRLLDALEAELDARLAESRRAVAEMAFRAISSLYEKERATRQEYAAAGDELRRRDGELARGRLAAERTREMLAQALAISAEELRVPAAEELGLGSFAERAAVFLASSGPDELGDRSASVRRAALDARGAELGVDGARAFSPDLSITAGTTLPELRYAAGVQLRFSGTDIARAARNDARRELADAGIALESARRLSRLDARRAVLELRLALRDLEAAAEATAESRLRLGQMRYLADTGRATDLDLAEAELEVLVAERAIVGAQVELAKKWFIIEFGQY